MYITTRFSLVVWGFVFVFAGQVLVAGDFPHADHDPFWVRPHDGDWEGWCSPGCINCPTFWRFKVRQGGSELLELEFQVCVCGVCHHVIADGPFPIVNGQVTFAAGNFSIRGVFPTRYTADGDYTYVDETCRQSGPWGAELPHEITTPTRPLGETFVQPGVAYTYQTGDSGCSYGHPILYTFHWNDSPAPPVWSPSMIASHIWSPGGPYYLRAQARCSVYANVVSPLSDSVMIIVGEPDLVVVGGVVHPPLALPGRNVLVFLREQNTGNFQAGGHWTHVYLSTNTAYGDEDFEWVSGIAVAALGPTKTFDHAATARVPSSLPAGTYHVLVRCDVLNDVAESNEGNNVKAIGTLQMFTHARHWLFYR